MPWNKTWTMNIEICCNSVQSAANAKAAGATRIELCQDLENGGTTPSYAAIKYCVETLKLDVFVLIRPRSGDFCYNELEIETMAEDVKVCKQLGVKGIVVGFLTPDGDIDTALTRRFVELAAPLPVTFHRAFDRCSDWQHTLEEVINCGCARILTSGCHPTTMEGLDTLRQIVAQAGDRITILAGGGITPGNVRQVILGSGVNEVHGSCKHATPGGYNETDPAQVRDLIANAQ